MCLDRRVTKEYLALIGNLYFSFGWILSDLFLLFACNTCDIGIMTQTTDMKNQEADLMNLLLSNTDENLGGHSNQPWTIAVHEHLHPGDDLLESLLGGCSGSEGVSSAPASPLWSPSASDSGVSDSHPWDLLDSPRHHASLPSFSGSYQAGPPPHQAPPMADLPPSLCAGTWGAPDVSIDLGCMEPEDIRENLGIAYYLTAPPTSMHPTNQTPTVKDLLLTNLGQKSQPNCQHSLQGLVLDEDEKKLLAKEGVNLSNKLPLSKHEERVLKKIRRKIRNKRSAQESRQKKREYIDSLEGRMSACSEYNLDLQRKVHQLEHSNNSLLEELSRLQDLVGTSPRSGPPTGTCLLVLLLSFSLILSVSLQPNSSSQRRVYTDAKVPSRSLLSVAGPVDGPLSTGVGALASLMEKLWGRTDILTSHDQEHNHKAGP
ncbi:cyclic AMP-responsive element-binding protein 3-like protein 3-A isoform X1 [Gadus macrocephalus]|uniref:cyclic AMP-responsive element-binding protein 3-like protein 3-A isoform X1 n=1 Tax=Gadus macrocephalus TaxID=80720 RepID=UPI0028CB13AD|nr:cyclic AMP-responsive element-binding protein 3-like protein 3-A isoform X1 [Gadus macrocephalus]